MHLLITFSTQRGYVSHLIRDIRRGDISLTIKRTQEHMGKITTAIYQDVPNNMVDYYWRAVSSLKNE